jgi:hypothetical protein
MVAVKRTDVQVCCSGCLGESFQGLADGILASSEDVAVDAAVLAVEVLPPDAERAGKVGPTAP